MYSIFMIAGALCGVYTCFCFVTTVSAKLECVICMMFRCLCDVCYVCMQRWILLYFLFFYFIYFYFLVSLYKVCRGVGSIFRLRGHQKCKPQIERRSRRLITK